MAFNPVASYTRWLHTQWPSGTVERAPVAQPDGRTNVPGLFIVGDLTGVPLLKFSADTGTRAVMTIDAEPSFKDRDTSDQAVVDIAIIGGGVSGFAAAKEAKKRGLSYVLVEAAQPFSTIVNFPKKKPIFTYPTDMVPAGDLQFNPKSDIKEGLLEDMAEQTLDQGIEVTKAHVDRVQRSGKLLELAIPKGDNIKAHRVIVAIGRSGNYRKLGVPGENLDKVFNRLHDPKDYCDQNVLIVGGGDSAMETANALAECGADVTLSYRKAEFNRPKPENVERLKALEAGAGNGTVRLMMASKPKEIREGEVVITDSDGTDQTIENDSVFTLIGREAPLDFFRKSGVTVSGDKSMKWWITLGVMVLICAWVYHWKGDYNIPLGLQSAFNNSFLGLDVSGVKGWFKDPSTLLGTLSISASGRSFYYTFIYLVLMTVFGIRRIRRRRTPYVTAQTISLITIQALPLFILPEIIFPLLGHNGFYESGLGQWFAESFFPAVNYGHGREYWRAYGFILAWPLMAWNWFTDAPLWGWLILGSLQTFVILPTMIYFWGKGVYCGWVCSCGGLAETLGDTHRHKMPHGPIWNRVNMIGQVFLGFAVVLMVLRIAGWVLPDGNIASNTFTYLAKGDGLPLLNYAYFVDLVFAGVIGVAMYFHFSGRVWCRFACPLAALMHIYARFSRFGIVADKKKCISCNVCTSVCHQGIDIMSFANKGKPMQDPECVRCSACVQSCPTGVLAFGQVDGQGATLSVDPAWLAASPVRMAEATQLTVNGKNV